jgi:hypothetical protein
VHIRPHYNDSTLGPIHAPSIVRQTIAVAVIVHSLINMDTRVVPAMLIRVEGAVQRGREVEHGDGVYGIDGAMDSEEIDHRFAGSFVKE